MKNRTDLASLALETASRIHGVHDQGGDTVKEFDGIAVFNRLLSVMPYPQQMSIVEMGIGELRFEWRGAVYRVSSGYHVEEVADGMLSGNDCAILIGHLLETAASRAKVVTP